MERIKKPYILEIEEAKAEMTAAVNEILGKHERRNDRNKR